MGHQVASHKVARIVRRRPPPFSRTRCAEMSPAGFLAVVAGWIGAVVAILAVSGLSQIAG
jgi:hypothetical protein